MGKLLFGTAGIPWSVKNRSTIGGLERVSELGLDAMELAFTHDVYMSQRDAKLVKKANEKTKVRLSAHAPYYINFNSIKPEVNKKSRRWLTLAAVAGFHAGAEKIVFHPGVYQKKTPSETMEIIGNALRELGQELKENGIEVMLCPELTGKQAQFGSLEELLALAGESEGIGLTLDFAHLHARRKGAFKKAEDFERVLKQIEQADSQLLKDLHMHVSGINYGEKGELNHLNLEESDFPFKEWLKALKAFEVGGTAICESPNLEDDALLLKKTYAKL